MARRTDISKISSALFTWTKGDPDGFGGVFGIDASEFEHAGCKLSRLGGSMAMHVGFIMISAKTGREATFIVTRIETNAEDEVTCWVLEPLFSSYNQRGCGRLQFVTVRVYNT